MEENKLNEKQEKAVELVCMGKNDKEIAKLVGVSRQWVNTWRNHDDDFKHALTLRRQALREQHQDSLNDLIEDAIGIVKQALANKADPKTQLKAAMYVLKISGLQGYLGEDQRKNQLEVENELVERTFIQVVKEMGFIDEN
jgi:transposase